MSAGHAGQDGRLEERLPELVARAAEDDLGAALAGVRDVALDLLQPGRVDERADVDALLEARADARAPRRRP